MLLYKLLLLFAFHLSNVVYSWAQEATGEAGDAAAEGAWARDAQCF